jgi:hypothetical protein
MPYDTTDVCGVLIEPFAQHDCTFSPSCFLLAGDFHQLNPAASMSLPKCAVLGTHDASSLVRSFLAMELIGQNRSKDPQHTANIEAIRTSPEDCPITLDRIAMYPILTAADVSAHPEFFTAPVLTTNNVTRVAIIAGRLPLFAIQQRQIILTYCMEVVGLPSQTMMSRLTPEQYELAVAAHPELLGRFCVGAACMELQNVSICCGAFVSADRAPSCLFLFSVF